MRFAFLMAAPLAALIAGPAFADKMPGATIEAETKTEAVAEAEPVPAEAAPKAAKKPKKAKRICRYVRADMSSRRKTRVCRTKDQWRELNRGS